MVKAIVLVSRINSNQILDVFHYADDRRVSAAVGAYVTCFAFRYVMANIAVSDVLAHIYNRLPECYRFSFILAEKMKGTAKKSRVTFYYLLAEQTATLGKLA